MTVDVEMQEYFEALHKRNKELKASLDKILYWASVNYENSAEMANAMDRIGDIARIVTRT